jgi:hypothetical protein
MAIIATLMIVTPSWADFTYKEFAQAPDLWKRGFVIGITNYLTTIVMFDGEIAIKNAYQRCLVGTSDTLLLNQVDAYVARNPAAFTLPMVAVVIEAMKDICQSELQKTRK